MERIGALCSDARFFLSPVVYMAGAPSAPCNGPNKMTEPNASTTQEASKYIGSGDNVYNGTLSSTHPQRQPTLEDYENIFGPAGRDVKQDLQRSKRHTRWHLPDALKGVNPWLTDRIDGLITDTTNSPFTTVILPYKYIDQVDAKIKWNVWSFDEALASRVPYESAARTLTQTKRSFAGYTVRQGLAITMEHNFMLSQKGRENFQHQLQQMIGSIQHTNDLDVTVALITAPSYARHQAEKYYTTNKTTHQTIREYIDMFGFFQKNVNSIDICIEEARSLMKVWGGLDPTFMLTNPRLTFQMTMIPEKTSYISYGPEGQKLLKDGPDLKSYRGLNIIHSKQVSMEDGAPPRDLLRRRVRTAEYYRITPNAANSERTFAFYNEAKDAWDRLSYETLLKHAKVVNDDDLPNGSERPYTGLAGNMEIIVLRPCIEHNMLGIVMGRGGLDDLGGTLWGQTELSVYDDSQHGIWGLSYKYNERAIVWNEKSLVRLFDIAYDGYNGGKDCRLVNVNDEGDMNRFKEAVLEVNRPYEGKSMLVFAIYRRAPGEACANFPSPILLGSGKSVMYLDQEHTQTINTAEMDISELPGYGGFHNSVTELLGDMHNSKSAGLTCQENETSCVTGMAFQGSMRVHDKDGKIIEEVYGSGHHGPDFVGSASVRSGKGVNPLPPGVQFTKHIQ